MIQSGNSMYSMETIRLFCQNSFITIPKKYQRIVEVGDLFSGIGCKGSDTSTEVGDSEDGHDNMTYRNTRVGDILLMVQKSG